MSKTNKCLLRNNISSVCDDIINGTKTNLDMDLVGKELCRYHYNNLIVNEKHRLVNVTKKQQCAHPNHEEYAKNNKRGRPRKHHLKKIPQRLQSILDLPPDTLVCNPCLNAMDRDKENQQFSDYQPPIRRTQSSNDTNDTAEHSYIFRNDLIYSAKEFKELEDAYNEVCKELDQVKLSM
jgi:hypothetical protein